MSSDVVVTGCEPRCNYISDTAKNKLSKTENNTPTQGKQEEEHHVIVSTVSKKYKKVWLAKALVPEMNRPTVLPESLWYNF